VVLTIEDAIAASRISFGPVRVTRRSRCDREERASFPASSQSAAWNTSIWKRGARSWLDETGGMAVECSTQPR
jgi:hypothetical protein